jgi:hypothetical protein
MYKSDISRARAAMTGVMAHYKSISATESCMEELANIQQVLNAADGLASPTPPTPPAGEPRPDDSSFNWRTEAEREPEKQWRVLSEPRRICCRKDSPCDSHRIKELLAAAAAPVAPAPTPIITVSDVVHFVRHGDLLHQKGEACYECDSPVAAPPQSAAPMPNEAGRISPLSARDWFQSQYPNLVSTYGWDEIHASFGEVAEMAELFAAAALSRLQGELAQVKKEGRK